MTATTSDTGFTSLFITARDGLRLHARDYGPLASPALPVVCLPGFARTFAGESTQAIQREVWHGPTTGDLTIESPGKPASAKGTIRLEAAGSGTREVVELEIKVKVPLIGGKLEKLMAEKVASGMDVEQTVGAAWLKEH